MRRGLVLNKNAKISPIQIRNSYLLFTSIASFRVCFHFFYWLKYCQSDRLMFYGSDWPLNQRLSWTWWNSHSHWLLESWAWIMQRREPVYSIQMSTTASSTTDCDQQKQIRDCHIFTQTTITLIQAVSTEKDFLKLATEMLLQLQSGSFTDCVASISDLCTKTFPDQ